MSQTPDFQIAVGDRAPRYRAALTGDDGLPLVLPTGSSVRLRLWLEGLYASPKVDAAATIITQNQGGSDLTATVVEYVWAAGDTDTAGVYRGRWMCEQPGGEPVSVPNAVGEYLKIVVDQPV